MDHKKSSMNYEQLTCKAKLWDLIQKARKLFHIEHVWWRRMTTTVIKLRHFLFLIIWHFIINSWASPKKSYSTVY